MNFGFFQVNLKFRGCKKQTCFKGVPDSNVRAGVLLWKASSPNDNIGRVAAGSFLSILYKLSADYFFELVLHAYALCFDSRICMFASMRRSALTHGQRERERVCLLVRVVIRTMQQLSWCPCLAMCDGVGRRVSERDVF